MSDWPISRDLSETLAIFPTLEQLETGVASRCLACGHGGHWRPWLRWVFHGSFCKFPSFSPTLTTSQNRSQMAGFSFKMVLRLFVSLHMSLKNIR